MVSFMSDLLGTTESIGRSSHDAADARRPLEFVLIMLTCVLLAQLLNRIPESAERVRVDVLANSGVLRFSHMHLALAYKTRRWRADGRAIVGMNGARVCAMLICTILAPFAVNTSGMDLLPPCLFFALTVLRSMTFTFATRFMPSLAIMRWCRIFPMMPLLFLTFLMLGTRLTSRVRLVRKRVLCDLLRWIRGVKIFSCRSVRI